MPSNLCKQKMPQKKIIIIIVMKKKKKKFEKKKKKIEKWLFCRRHFVRFLFI